MPQLETALPADLDSGTFALRVMTPDGPSVFALLHGAAFDMTPAFGTASAWLNAEDPVGAIRLRGVPAALDLRAAYGNAHHARRDPSRPWLLAPVDLQVIKAAGVTYVRSMLERVIEERCRGDAGQAEAVRAEVRRIIGDDLANLVPGSPEAMQVRPRWSSAAGGASTWRSASARMPRSSPRPRCCPPSAPARRSASTR
jgi:fumarylacetoacetate (FAA) hydrolase family protein